MKKEVKRFILLERSPARVWESLTRSDELNRWLCDESEVELRPGGKFEFRGPHVFGGGGGQETERALSPELLSFRWPLMGEHTHVSWRLERQMDFTRLLMTHTAESNERVAFHGGDLSPKDFSQPLVDLNDIWWYYSTVLKTWLETGSVPFRARFNFDPSASQFEHSMELPVDRDKLFALITQPAALDQWISDGAEVDLKVGGKLSYGWGVGPDKITRLVPGKELTCSWLKNGTPSMEACWKLESAGANVRLTLVQSGFVSGDEKLFVQMFQGWSGFLACLAHVALTGASIKVTGGPLK